MTQGDVLTALSAEIALVSAAEARVKALETALETAKQQAFDSAKRVAALHAQLLSVMAPDVMVPTDDQVKGT